MSRAAWLIVLVALGGCRPSIPSGALSCGADALRPCPEGFHCTQGRCWLDGEGPILDGGLETDGAPPRKTNGEGCGQGDECASGHCVDQVCCDTACDGACQGCALPGSPGTCTNVSGGPVGGRACPGDQTGPCAGTCSGSSPTCTFPPVGTGCGAACDGTCNSQGVCSTQSGNSCPGGYACGPTGCKTSCSQPSDCQPFFSCVGSACVRVPEADCLDGLDNNGDGKADCADPTCTSVECVAEPPIGVKHGYLAGAQACDAQFGTPLALHDGTTTNTPCAGCACDRTLDCTYTVRFWPSHDLCGSMNTWYEGTFAVRYPTGCGQALSNGQAFSGLGISTLYYRSYELVSPPGPGTAGCTITTSASKTTIKWSAVDSYCSAKRTSATCAQGQACVPKVPAAETQCVRLNGAGQTCPAGYPTLSGGDNGTWYGGESDNRSCQCGSCTVSPADCDTTPNATVDLWSTSTTCSGAADGRIYGPTPAGTCYSANPTGSNWPDRITAVQLATPTPRGTCSVSPTDAGGGVVANTPYTVCCK